MRWYMHPNGRIQSLKANRMGDDRGGEAIRDEFLVEKQHVVFDLLNLNRLFC